MKKSLFFLFAAMLVLSITAESRANGVGVNMGVSGTVNRRCNLTTTPVNFGSIFAINDLANGGIHITCTRGLPYKIYIDGGLHQTTANAVRRIKHSATTQFMSYQLFRTGTTQWGTAGCTTVICNPTYTGGTPWILNGSGAVQNFTVFGRTTSFNPTSGSYADAAQAVVEF